MSLAKAHHLFFLHAPLPGHSILGLFLSEAGELESGGSGCTGTGTWTGSWPDSSCAEVEMLADLRSECSFTAALFIDTADKKETLTFQNIHHRLDARVFH